MAEKAKAKQAARAAPKPVKEVEFHVPSGTLSLAVGRWGPYTAENGKVLVPVEAISTFQGDGYVMVNNDLGKAYVAYRQHRADVRSGLLAHDDAPLRSSATPPLSDEMLAEIGAVTEVQTEDEAREDD